MKNKYMKAIILAGVLLTANAAISAEAPKNWFAAGSHPKDYEMSVDRKVAHDGKSSAQLKSIADGSYQAFGNFFYSITVGYP